MPGEKRHKGARNVTRAPTGKRKKSTTKTEKLEEWKVKWGEINEETKKGKRKKNVFWTRPD